MKWVGTVPLAALENGALVRLSHPPFDVIVGLVDGEPYAIEDACNHAGASLTEGGWSVLRPACVVCPMHGYVFSLTSGELISPKGLCDDQRTFRARIEGDVVVVRDPFSLTIA
jgi:hypothetical protein